MELKDILLGTQLQCFGTCASLYECICYFRYSEQREVKMGFGRICYIIISTIPIKSGVVWFFKPQCR